MIHPSHYFERVEHYLQSANGIKPLQTLEELVKMDGAPEEMVDSVVNGALRDFIFDRIPAPNDFVHVYGPDGNAIYEPKKERTFEQWQESLSNTILGINRERIEAIMLHMFEKGMIVNRAPNNFVYRNMAPIRRCPLSL